MMPGCPRAEISLSLQKEEAARKRLSGGFLALATVVAAFALTACGDSIDSFRSRRIAGTPDRPPGFEMNSQAGATYERLQSANFRLHNATVGGFYQKKRLTSPSRKMTGGLYGGY